MALVASHVCRIHSADDSCTASAVPFFSDKGRTFFLTAAHAFDFRGFQFNPWQPKPTPCDTLVLGEVHVKIQEVVLHPLRDVAMFWVEAGEIPLLETRWTPPRQYEEVFSFAFPWGSGPMVYQGWVGPQRDGEFSHSAIVMPGASGGALVDKDFQVIGIIMATQDTLGWSTSLVSVREWVRLQLHHLARRK